MKHNPDIYGYETIAHIFIMIIITIIKIFTILMNDDLGGGNPQLMFAQYPAVGGWLEINK